MNTSHQSMAHRQRSPKVDGDLLRVKRVAFYLVSFSACCSVVIVIATLPNRTSTATRQGSSKQLNDAYAVGLSLIVLVVWSLIMMCLRFLATITRDSGLWVYLNRQQNPLIEVSVDYGKWCIRNIKLLGKQAAEFDLGQRYKTWAATPSWFWTPSVETEWGPTNVRVEPFTGELGTIERLQVAIERYLGRRCYWWPLRQPPRIDEIGTFRITWRCACGDDMHLLVPLNHTRELVDAIVKCNEQTGARGDPILPLHQESSSTDIGSSIWGSSKLPWQRKICPCRSVTTKENSRQPSHALQPLEKHIHWCIDERPETTRLIDIDTKDVCEQCVIQKLLDEYATVRGWQSWLTLTECKAVKFCKFRRVYDNQNVIACGSKAFPEPQNMEYEYEPPDVSQTLLEAEMRHHIAKRGRCAVYGRTRIIAKLPKKIPISLDSRSGVEGYGMYAVNELARWRWRLLVIMAQIGPVGFSIYWLLERPGDLQNAFTPLGLVLTLLAVFRPSTSVTSDVHLHTD